MSNPHDVIDSVYSFIIDPVTRAIQPPKNGIPILIQHDNNSERITFEIDRYVDGHDMLACTKVEVNYTNINSANKAEFNDGVYEVDDLKEGVDGKVEFTWLISSYATLYTGYLEFSVCFSCFENNTNTYSWNSGIGNLLVGKRINASETVINEYPDLLHKWKKDLFDGVYGAKKINAGVLEPVGIPYIWFDTRDYQSHKFKYIGRLVVKDENYNIKNLYPVVKFAGIEDWKFGGGLQISENGLHLKLGTGLSFDDEGNLRIKDASVIGKGLYYNDNYELEVRLDSKLKFMPDGSITTNNVFNLSATFKANGWSKTAPYIQTVNVANVLNTDNPIVDLNVGGVSSGEYSDLIEQWGYVGRISTGDGTLTAYCYEYKPTMDITINAKVVR